MIHKHDWEVFLTWRSVRKFPLLVWTCLWASLLIVMTSFLITADWANSLWTMVLVTLPLAIFLVVKTSINFRFVPNTRAQNDAFVDVLAACVCLMMILAVLLSSALELVGEMRTQALIGGICGICGIVAWAIIVVVSGSSTLWTSESRLAELGCTEFGVLGFVCIGASILSSSCLFVRLVMNIDDSGINARFASHVPMAALILITLMWFGFNVLLRCNVNKDTWSLRDTIWFAINGVLSLFVLAMSFGGAASAHVRWIPLALMIAFKTIWNAIELRYHKYLEVQYLHAQRDFILAFS